MIEEIQPNKDVLRVVEKCLDVLLTAHEENWGTARLVAEGLSMPRIIVNSDVCPDCGADGPGLHSAACPTLKWPHENEPRFADARSVRSSAPETTEGE